MRILTCIIRVLGLAVPAALIMGLVIVPAASASTQSGPPMVQAWSPIVNGHYTGPFIGATPGTSQVAMSIVQVYATNVGRVIQVDSPFDGGPKPMYHLNAIARPAAAQLASKPIPTTRFRTMQCSIVQRTLVPGLMARWPHVRCSVLFRQRIPHYLGSALQLTYGGLTSFFSIKGVVAPCKVTTRVRIPVYS